MLEPSQPAIMCLLDRSVRGPLDRDANSQHGGIDDLDGAGFCHPDKPRDYEDGLRQCDTTPMKNLSYTASKASRKVMTTAWARVMENLPGTAFQTSREVVPTICAGVMATLMTLKKLLWGARRFAPVRCSNCATETTILTGTQPDGPPHVQW